MAQVIIKQPDGKLALFDNNYKGFILMNQTRAGIVEYYAERARKEATEWAFDICSRVEADHPNPYALKRDLKHYDSGDNNKRSSRVTRKISAIWKELLEVHEQNHGPVTATVQASVSSECGADPYA